jgi:hypothetical protein
MKGLENHHARVRVEIRIWANFGEICFEALKGACSCNCLPIPYLRQYRERGHQLTAESEDILPHGIGENEHKRNLHIDVVTYVPSVNDAAIFATYSYSLTGRIPYTPDGKTLFRP